MPRSKYRKRTQEQIIRSRLYKYYDTKKEMVVLYLAFRKEVAEVLDRNKFLDLYDDIEEILMQ